MSVLQSQFYIVQQYQLFQKHKKTDHTELKNIIVAFKHNNEMYLTNELTFIHKSFRLK